VQTREAHNDEMRNTVTCITPSRVSDRNLNDSRRKYRNSGDLGEGGGARTSEKGRRD
jgi:hypothetical protein